MATAAAAGGSSSNHRIFISSGGGGSSSSKTKCKWVVGVGSDVAFQVVCQVTEPRLFKFFYQIVQDDSINRFQVDLGWDKRVIVAGPESLAQSHCIIICIDDGKTGHWVSSSSRVVVVVVEEMECLSHILDRCLQQCKIVMLGVFQ